MLKLLINSLHRLNTSFFSPAAIFLLLLAINLNNTAQVLGANTEARMSATNSFNITTSAFKEGQTIPKQYTADGANISPPLSWTNAPAGTQSYALLCDDPDAPMGTWIHWMIYDIPANKTNFEQAIQSQARFDDGTKQGTTSFHRIGYGGTSPPPGSPHRYYFKLYALNSLSQYEPGVDINKFRQFVDAHKLGQTQIMGTYGR